MATDGMRYSLPSRELIADSLEMSVMAGYMDGVIAIPSCDKNMPGSLIGISRCNRPAVIVYGGTVSWPSSFTVRICQTHTSK